MELCKTIFRRLTLAFTLLFTGIVFYRLTSGIPFCHLAASAKHPTFLLLSAAFVLGCALLLFGGKCLTFTKKQADLGTIAVFGLMILVQLLLIFTTFRYSLPWADTLSVFNEAISMSASEHPSIRSAGRYFEMYGNNYFFTIVLCYYFKFFRLFGLTAYWIEGLLLNMAAMDLGVYLCVFMARKVYGAPKGLLLAVLCLLNPILYVFLPFVYTNTISIPFTMGIFCLAMLLFQETRPRRRVLYLVLEAVLLVCGFFIRVTTLIPVIALVVYRLLKGQGETMSRPGRSTVLKEAAVFAAAFLLLFGGCRMLVNTHVSEELRSRNFPVTHWVMMGLQGNGGYSASDEDFTYRFPEKDDKTKANIREIRSRLETLGSQDPSCILDLFSRKLTTTWATDLDGLYLETGWVQAYRPLQNYLFGFKNSLLLYYYALFKLMLFGFCILGLLRELRSRKTGPIYPYTLALFGFFLFYLLWEANCRYAICLTLMLCMLAFHGMDGLLSFDVLQTIGSHYINCKQIKRAVGILLILVILAPCLYAMYQQFPAYTQQPIAKSDSIVRTIGRAYHENQVTDLIRENKTLTQTFTTEHRFNEIGLYCAYNEEEKWSNSFREELSYRFRLLDTNGNILAEEVFGVEDSRKYYKLFGFPTVMPDGSTEYTIELTAASEDAPDRLNFIYYDFDTYDYISGADLGINGQNLHRDLIFMVTNNYSGAYTTPTRYAAACAGLILLPALLSGLLLTDYRPRKRHLS